MSGPTLADLLACLEERVPSAWADPWDKVGLLAGDRSARVSRVFVTLDPTPEALAAARAAGANVLLTHHPACLEMPDVIAPAPGLRGVLFSAVSGGTALVAAHTNLDRSPEGADALAHALGLSISGPLERSGQDVRVIVTYAPEAAAQTVLAALAQAGAGRVGAYAGCSFASDGEGRFTPLAGASPRAGGSGGPSTVPERRIEVVCSPDLTDAAVDALRAAHPYEEPVVLVSEASLSRGAARAGRICEAPASSTLGTMAELVSRALGVRATVWGDPGLPVRRVALAPGSGRSLVGDATASGCDVIVTGELRYHEALDAAAASLAVIEAGHDATEWPLTRVLAAIAATTPGLAETDVVLDRPRTRWWTAEGA